MICWGCGLSLKRHQQDNGLCDACEKSWFAGMLDAATWEPLTTDGITSDGIDIDPDEPSDGRDKKGGLLP